MARIAPASPVQAQDIATGMVFTDGKRVYRAAKIVPLNIVGTVVKSGDSVTVETGATHVQIRTRTGFLNLPITAVVVPLVTTVL